MGSLVDVGKADITVVKIGDLPQASSVGGADELILNQGGITKRVQANLIGTGGSGGGAAAPHSWYYLATGGEIEVSPIIPSSVKVAWVWRNGVLQNSEAGDFTFSNGKVTFNPGYPLTKDEEIFVVGWVEGLTPAAIDKIVKDILQLSTGMLYLDNFVDVTGGTPADDGLKTAIALAEASGKTICVPAGSTITLATAGINIPEGVRIIGAGGADSCTFVIDHEDVTANQFIVNSRNVISGINFWYKRQTFNLMTKPIIQYKPLFYGAGYSSTFEYLNIGNAYYGFQLGGTDIGGTGKIVMRQIFGAPIFRGLSLDRCQDIPRISDIHWNYNLYLDKWNEYAQDLKQWMFENATGFHFGRVDFAAVFRLFCFGYKIGYHIRSERFPGSADSLRLVECDADICSRPIFAQNFTGVLYIKGGKFTGNSAGTNGLVEKEVSTCLFYETVPASQIVLDSVTFNNLTGDAINYGGDLRATNCKVYNVGKSGSQRAAFRPRGGSNANLYLSGVDIRLNLDNVRGVWSDESTGTVTLVDGTSITGLALEGYRWTGGGKVVTDGTCSIGIQSRSLGSWHNNANSWFFSETMPTVGAFYKEGDFVFCSKPRAVGVTVPANYSVIGWSRVTNANAGGTNHVLNTDWFEVKAFIDTVAKDLPKSGSTRPTTGPIGMTFFDTALKLPIILANNSPMEWVKWDGTPV